MLARSQGRCCRVVLFWIIATAPVVGLSKSAPKNDKTYVTYHIVPHACFLLHDPKETTEMRRLVLVRARTVVKILLRYSTGKIKSYPMEPLFQT